jgi:hypothetical protein
VCSAREDKLRERHRSQQLLLDEINFEEKVCMGHCECCECCDDDDDDNDDVCDVLTT